MIKTLPEQSANKMLSGSCHVHSLSTMDSSAKSKDVKEAEDIPQVPQLGKRKLFGNLLERMNRERRSPRGEPKGKLRGFAEDPEQAPPLKQTIAPVSDRKQSDPCRVPYFFKIPKFMKKRPAGPPAEITVRIQHQRPTKKVKEAEDVLRGSQNRRPQLRTSNSYKVNLPREEAEDGLRGSQHRRPQLQASNSFKNTLPRAQPQRRTPPRATNYLDASEFRPELGQNRVPYLGKTSDASAFTKPKGASPPALSRFMKAQPEPSANKLIGSRSVQYQPPTDLSAKSKKVKEAEDVHQGSHQRRPQFRASKSFDDDLPRAQPQRRTPPRATKYLDENEFRPELGQNRVPYLGKNSDASAFAKLKGASPPALSRWQPEPSVNRMIGPRSEHHQPPTDLSAKSKKVKEAEDVHQGSQQKRPQLRASKSFDDDLPRAPPQRRAPPSRTKSPDENEFGPELGQNRVPDLGKTSDASAFTKPTDASTPVLSRWQPEPSVSRMIGSRSEHHQPPTDLSAKSKKVKEAEDVHQGSPQRRRRLRASKSFEDDLPRAQPQRRTPPRATKSLDENEFGPELALSRWQP
jgi:hypothetical protein